MNLHNITLTSEELECVRVCLTNAPIPYDITKKKIPADILHRIGYPTKDGVGLVISSPASRSDHAG